jgi:hypothetical protein
MFDDITVKALTVAVVGVRDAGRVLGRSIRDAGASHRFGVAGTNLLNPSQSTEGIAGGNDCNSSGRKRRADSLLRR